MSAQYDLDAIVIGSGPNGLAAAVTLARAGLQVEVVEAQAVPGGGVRTLDLGLAPGLVHDICSAVHPMALASPFLASFDLAARGVEFVVPEVSYAQPLDGGTAALAWHDLERTAKGLGADGDAWRRLFRPLVNRMEEVAWLGLGDKRSVPPRLRSAEGAALAARFAARLLQQGTPAWQHPLHTEPARALLAGVASHAIGPLPSPATAAAALLLATAAHAGGWPIPVGGSKAIAEAFIADLEAHGGRVRTGIRVSHLRELPRARAYLLDTGAEAAAAICHGVMPDRVRSGLLRLGHGNAAAKVDFVLSGPVPWTDADVGRAGTVHLGGTRGEMAFAEAEVAVGRLPERPVTLLSDPVVADPSREVDGLRPLWTYAHVPRGCTADVTELVTAQIERFAPGFRDVVVASRCIPADRLHEHDENLVGGDIAGGTVTLPRMVARPRFAADPYGLGIPGVYLCSAATPPGPAVHGMNGWFAARRALADRFGIGEQPSLAPGMAGRSHPAG